MSNLKYKQRAPITFRLGGNSKFILGCLLTFGAPSAISLGLVFALSI